MNILSNTQDPFFLEVALRLGYKRQEIQPISIQDIQKLLPEDIKRFSKNQQNHYVQRKFQAIQQRQHKIIRQINQQMQKIRYQSAKNKKGFNPVIKKLLQDHQQRLQKKARYQQRVRISKTRQIQHRKINNTIDFGRTSPNFSNNSKNSRVSKKSIKSENSNISERSNSSHKNRLQIVRMRQKQEEKYKKNLFRYSEHQKRKKAEKVHQSRLSLSRRLKTKSQISQQAVKQRKKQLQSVKIDEIRDHIERLKYKMLKNEYLRNKQQERKVSKSITYDGVYKKQLKNMFQRNEREMHKERYQSKLRQAQKKKKQVQQYRKLQTQNKLRQKRQKQLHVHKYREYLKMQQEQRKKQTIFYQINDLERAKQKKQKILSEKKMKFIQSKVKHQIVRSNYNSIENRKRLQSQSKARQINEKLKEINDIQQIKRRLTRQRNRKKDRIFNKFQTDQLNKVSFY